jgi:hypothetical protein
MERLGPGVCFGGFKVGRQVTISSSDHQVTNIKELQREEK